MIFSYYLCDMENQIKKSDDVNAYNRMQYNKKKDDPEFKRRKSESARKSYQKHKKRKLEKAKEYREKNRDKYNKYRNEYRTKNPRGIYEVIKQGAKKRGVNFSLDKEDFVLWYNAEERICIYCKRTEDDILKDKDIIQNKSGRLTIDRLNNNRGYRLNNIGLCCRRCNTIKGNFFTQKEMEQIGKIIKAKYESIS